MRLLLRGLRWLAIGLGLLASLLAAVWVLGNAMTRTRDVDDVAYAREHLGVPELRSEMVAAAGVQLHVVSAGPQDGVPVVLLHGIPDFWWGWRRQFPALVAAGFRVIAPDLRGYNRSEKPPEVASYRLALVAEDVGTLIEALGYDSAYLVGHDAGALVGWKLSAQHPERVRGFVSLGVGHPDTYRGAVDRGPAYPILNAFGAAILRPGVPRFLLRPFDWLPLTLGLRISGHDSFDEQELDLYRASWARDDALTHMFFWALANGAGSGVEPPELGRVSTPVLMVVVPDDASIPAALARQSAAHCTHFQSIEVPGVGHWVHREAAQRTNELIVGFVRSIERP